MRKGVKNWGIYTGVGEGVVGEGVVELTVAPSLFRLYSIINNIIPMRTIPPIMNFIYI